MSEEYSWAKAIATVKRFRLIAVAITLWGVAIAVHYIFSKSIDSYNKFCQFVAEHPEAPASLALGLGIGLTFLIPFSLVNMWLEKRGASRKQELIEENNQLRGKLTDANTRITNAEQSVSNLLNEFARPIADGPAYLGIENDRLIVYFKIRIPRRSLNIANYVKCTMMVRRIEFDSNVSQESFEFEKIELQADGSSFEIRMEVPQKAAALILINHPACLQFLVQDITLTTGNERHKGGGIRIPLDIVSDLRKGRPW
ncbi:MAG TPA: hypothetical protein VEK08_05690 [Planctomycetota bacterium]|nr:hypothetical protein [Planctomycetota bacterium]